MNDRVKSELRKLFTTRTTYLIIAALFVISSLQVIAPLADSKPADWPERVGAAGLIPQWLPSLAGFLILGMRSVTEEFRYGTITPTLLVRPQRAQIVVSKAAVLAAVAALFTIVAEAITFAIATPWLAAGGSQVVVSSEAIWVLVASPIALALFAALSVGVGAIVRNDVAAIALGLIWVLILENLIGLKWRDLFEYLPGQAANALSGSGSSGLVQWEGGLVLALYALVAIVGAMFAMTRRDVA